jgi:hypothetical protein
MLFAKLFKKYRLRKRAREESMELCRSLYPDEPIFGAVVCADETDRLVVRVFTGERAYDGTKTVPWKECRLFAVAKDDCCVDMITDQKYFPRLR